MTATEAPFDTIREIADTVLFEGYMLYPYRADDPKNRVRWQFGVLAPPGFADIDPSERSTLQTDCLIEGGAMRIAVQVRFLHVQRRKVERATADLFVPIEALDVGDATYLPWDEAVVREEVLTFDVPAADEYVDAAEFAVDGDRSTEPLRDPSGDMVGRLVRDRIPVGGRLSIEVRPLPGPYGLRRLRLQLTNTTAWQPSGRSEPDRPDALRHALVAAHLVVSVADGRFISLIDPPEWAKGYVEECEQVGSFPVLAGPPGDQSMVLASPIILYDHPQVAPESASQFCDATEMDEMLTLRTLTLTDEEKRMVRGSDARGAALVDQIDNLPPELMERLHGAIRSMRSLPHPAEQAVPQPALPHTEEIDALFDPDADVVMVDGVPVSRGSLVRLHPSARADGRIGADAQDMFLAGRTATVEAVLFDLDGGHHLAVSLNDLTDDGYQPHGRYLYFAPDEVEPINDEAG